MKSIVHLVFVVLSALTALPSYAQEVSEASVMKLIAELDRAISARNAVAVGKAISDDVDISGTVTVQGTTQVFRMNKAQYMEVLKDTWAQAEAYSYKRENLKVEVSGGKARISGRVTEKMRMGGQSITSTANESAVIESVAGKLQITRIAANGSVQ